MQALWRWYGCQLAASSAPGKYRKQDTGCSRSVAAGVNWLSRPLRAWPG